MTRDRPRAERLRTLMAATVVGVALLFVARATRDALEPANIAVRLLRNGDAEERLQAAKDLELDQPGPSLRPKAAEALSAALADPSVELVAAAMHSLSVLIQAEPDPDLALSWTESLAAGLRDPRADVRALTASTLSNSKGLRRPARSSRLISDALVALVDDPDPGVRPIAIQALGAAGSGEAALQALTRVLKDDPSPTNRQAAAQALGAYPDHPDEVAVALLRALGSDRDAEVRAVIGLVLTGIRFRPNLPPRSTALVPFLIEITAAAGDCRRHAAMILGDLGPGAVAAVPALIAELGAADARGDSSSVERLPPPAVLAAEALGKIAPGTPREREAAEALAAVVRSGSLDPRGVAAAVALARFPGATDLIVPRLIAIVEAGCRDEETADRPTTIEQAEAARKRSRDAYLAAEALGLAAPGTPREPEAVAALIRLLDSRAIMTHSTAAEALGRFGPAAKSALPQLREMTKLQDPGRRGRAEEAVRRIEGAAPGP